MQYCLLQISDRIAAASGLERKLRRKRGEDMETKKEFIILIQL
jgi:hypothetical protein